MSYDVVLRGWINYFKKFCPSAMRCTLQFFNNKLALWAVRKHKKFKGSLKQAKKWLKKIAKRDSKLFYHWQLGILPEVR